MPARWETKTSSVGFFPVPVGLNSNLASASRIYPHSYANSLHTCSTNSPFSHRAAPSSTSSLRSGLRKIFLNGLTVFILFVAVMLNIRSSFPTLQNVLILQVEFLILVVVHSTRQSSGHNFLQRSTFPREMLKAAHCTHDSTCSDTTVGRFTFCFEAKNKGVKVDSFIFVEASRAMQRFVCRFLSRCLEPNVGRLLTLNPERLRSLSSYRVWAFYPVPKNVVASLGVL